MPDSPRSHPSASESPTTGPHQPEGLSSGRPTRIPGSWTVEIVGYLLPGLVMLSVIGGSLTALLLPLGIESVELASTLLASTLLASTLLASGTSLALVLVLAYGLGRLASTRGLESADRAGASAAFYAGDGDHGVVRRRDDRQRVDFSFPYKFLREELEDWGETELAEAVPWSGSGPGNVGARSIEFLDRARWNLRFRHGRAYGVVALADAKLFALVGLRSAGIVGVSGGLAAALSGVVGESVSTLLLSAGVLVPSALLIYFTHRAVHPARLAALLALLELYVWDRRATEPPA